ncbi:MAG: hypothetical protein H7842_01315 [Gammaproteobacteria bacterium SHHR-1]|uniref:hypothetical protein n=1 Tax=Magnetovirga frankeli TaxID=947516 RepID=UPI00129400BB|nr:hypothetical protein D5125_14030 [gamma proteobacterium SS-5]
MNQNFEAMAAEYRRLFAVLRDLHMEIFRLVPKTVLHEAAKRLDMLQQINGRKTLIFSYEEESDAFSDYLLYLFRPQGVKFSYVQRMLNSKRYPADSDQGRLLAQMAKARFSLFRVQGLVPDVGVRFYDLVIGQEFLVFDSSLPRYKEADVLGLVLGLRIFPFQGYWMHSGAVLNTGLGQRPDHSLLSTTPLDEKTERKLNEKIILQYRALHEGLE